MGGGRQCLQSSVNGSFADPIDTWSCYSSDGRNLIQDWIKDKADSGFSYQVLNNNEELQNVDLTKDYTFGNVYENRLKGIQCKFLGIFANGHLKMDYERDKGPKGMPSLTNMTEKAIYLLQRNKNGYVLMVSNYLCFDSTITANSVFLRPG